MCISHCQINPLKCNYFIFPSFRGHFFITYVIQNTLHFNVNVILYQRSKLMWTCRSNYSLNIMSCVRMCPSFCVLFTPPMHDRPCHVFHYFSFPHYKSNITYLVSLHNTVGHAHCCIMQSVVVVVFLTRLLHTICYHTSYDVYTLT